MAVIQERYTSKRDVGEPAIVAYFRSFIGTRKALNDQALEAQLAALDPKALSDQSIAVRSNLGKLYEARQKAASGETEAVTGIIGDMLRHDADLQRALIRADTELGTKRMDVRQRTIENQYDFNEKLMERLTLPGLARDRVRGLPKAIADNPSAPANPKAMADTVRTGLSAALDAAKNPLPGTPEHDAVLFAAYNELRADPAASAHIRDAYFGGNDPDAYMEQRHGFRTEEQLREDLATVSRGGVRTPTGTRAFVQANPEYIGGATSKSTSTTTGGTAPSPAPSGSISIKGAVSDPAALAALVKDPTNVAALDALIAKEEARLADLDSRLAEMGQRRADLFRYGYPNSILRNPNRVVSAEDLERLDYAASLSEGERTERMSAVGRAGLPTDNLKRQQEMGGIPESGARFDEALLRDRGPGVYAWAAQQLRALGSPVEHDGWQYEPMPDGSVRVVVDPREGSPLRGQIVKKGSSAHEAIAKAIAPTLAERGQKFAAWYGRMPEGIRAPLAGAVRLAETGDYAGAATEAAGLKGDMAFGAYAGLLADDALKTDDPAQQVAKYVELRNMLDVLPEDTRGEWAEPLTRTIDKGFARKDREGLNRDVAQYARALQKAHTGNATGPIGRAVYGEKAPTPTERDEILDSMEDMAKPTDPLRTATMTEKERGRLAFEQAEKRLAGLSGSEDPILAGLDEPVGVVAASPAPPPMDEATMAFWRKKYKDAAAKGIPEAERDAWVAERVDAFRAMRETEAQVDTIKGRDGVAEK